MDEVVELVVTLAGVQSRQRRELGRLQPGAHDIDLRLDPNEYVGRVDLSVSARLKQDIPADVGFAHLKASRLSEAHIASVWFTEPPQALGDALEIRWENFDEDGDLIDGQLFTLRMEDRPVIILNSAIPSAYDILSSKGTHGAAARIRDAVFAQIVHQAWSSILAHCLLEVARHEENEPAETVLAELEEWQAQVVRAWALEFIPSESNEESAALALIDEARSVGSLALLHRLPEAIQSKCLTISGYEGLIKEFDKFQGASR